MHLKVVGSNIEILNQLTGHIKLNMADVTNQSLLFGINIEIQKHGVKSKENKSSNTTNTTKETI